MLEDSRWQHGPLSKPIVKSSKPSLALIILAVSDLERSLGFYRRVFDWRQTVNTPGYVEFELPNDLRLGLYLREGFARNVGQTSLLVPEGGLTSTEVYFQTDDLARLIARLDQAGARKLSPLALRDWGDEAAYFADPDGNVIVAAQTVSI
jgi:catechol 2,3-dioxygenase-like lactoylglutathione lyase family enzyme